MGYDDMTKLTISTNKTFDNCGKDIFGNRRHNLNKLDRDSQNDAINTILSLFVYWFQIRLNKPFV